jgi:hypothetical protein
MANKPFTVEELIAMIRDSVAPFIETVPVPSKSWELFVDGTSLGIISGETAFDQIAAGVYILSGCGERARVQYRNIHGTDLVESKFQMPRKSNTVAAAKDAALKQMLKARVFVKHGKVVKIGE